MSNERKVLRRLKRRQVDLASELEKRLRRASKNAAAVVISNSADKQIVNSARKRAAIYAAMQREFAEAAGKGQEALERAVEAVASSSHGLAVEGITARPGTVVAGDWQKFDARRVERYLELISPENGQDLFAASFGKMADESIRKMRSSFVDVYRQSQVEGWTLQKTAKTMQQAWDDAAGDLGAYRFTDIAGRAWSNADYLNMVSRTTLARVHRESYLDTLTEYGDDLVKVQNQGENCPICDAWSGIILSISGNDSRYPSYSDARAGGLFHPNCDCMTVGLSTALDGADIERQKAQKNADWEDPASVQEYNDGIKIKEKVAAGSTTEQADIDLKRDKLKNRLQVALLEEHNAIVDQIPDDVLKGLKQDQLPRFEFSKRGDKAEYWSTKSSNGGVIHVPREGAKPELIMAEFNRLAGVGPSIVPKISTTSLKVAEKIPQKLQVFIDELKNNGFSDEIIESAKRIPFSVLDKIDEMPSVKPINGRAHYKLENVIAINKNPKEWNGSKTMFEHEFGHAVHTRSKHIKHLRIEAGLKESIEKDFDSFKAMAKEQHGNDWRRAYKRTSREAELNFRKLVGIDLAKKMTLEEKGRFYGLVDSVGGISKGLYGYGHSVKTYKGSFGIDGYKETYANCYVAAINGWTEYDKVMPLTMLWIKSNLGLGL